MKPNNVICYQKLSPTIIYVSDKYNAMEVLFTICINYPDLDDCLTTSDANTLNGIYYPHRGWF